MDIISVKIKLSRVMMFAMLISFLGGSIQPNRLYTQ